MIKVYASFEKEFLHEIFPPDKFIEYMVEHDEIYEEENKPGVPYGLKVTGLCHNSVAWMTMRLRKYFPKFLNVSYLAYGNYRVVFGNEIVSSIRSEHSWLEIKDDAEVNLIVDLTAAQFRRTDKQLLILDRNSDIENEQNLVKCYNRVPENLIPMTEYETINQFFLNI